MDAKEPCLLPFPMPPCETANDDDGGDTNYSGGPGQVFASPFIVTPLPRCANVGSLLSSLSAVAAFNVGIACHRSSLEVLDDSRRRQHYLLQAKQFYQTAYELLDRLSYISPNGSLIHVYMALCTNLAEIEFEQGNLDASRQWRTALRDTMAAVPEQKESQVYKHFHNTSIFYRFEIPAAQAA